MTLEKLRRVWLVSLLLGCATDDDEGGDGSASGGDGMCVYKDPGTDWAPCESDGDCFSGFCELDGNPGPYCHIPTHVGGQGYSCTSDDICESVLSEEASARGIIGVCRNDDIYNGCSFQCPM